MKKVLKSLVSIIMLVTTFAYITPVYAVVNKETVYSKLDANGEKYKTIVTAKEDDEINQTESNKDLPLEAKITYTLDGKEINPENLAGKSGKVKIKIEYINKSSKQVTINGKTQTIYTPFVVTLGTVINNKNNKNIKVTDGGRIIENGDKTVVVGIVFPGLDESLNLSGKLSDTKIPSSIEITMDAENFEMSNIMTYATPKVFTEDINWSKFDDLFDKVNELKSGINKIEDGANKLADGTTKLDDGAKELSEGISAAYKGSKEIKKQVSNSITTIKNDKSKALDKDTLNKIGEQAGNTASESIKKQLETIGNSAKSSATKAIESKENEIGKQAKNLAEKNIEDQKATIAKQAETEAAKTIGNKETKNKIFTTLKNLIETNMNSEKVQKAIGQKAAEALSNNETATKTVTNATTSGVTSIQSELKTLGNSIKADAGAIEDINISIDYTKYAEYESLDSETKEAIKKLANKMQEDAKKQSTDKANAAIIKAKSNAEESAKKSATEALTKVSTLAAKNASVTAAQSEISSLVSQATTAGVKEALAQLENILAANSDAVAQKVLPFACEIATKTAKQVAGTVAEQTAKQTAKTLAPEIATETAKTVAMQVAPTVATQTATTVADEVADEVKNVAMNTVKEQMKTLLNDGMSPLTDGLSKLDKGSKSLKDGTKELKDGSKELSKGIHKFNSEGISKISNFVNIDLKNFVTRGKKLEELAKEYNKFDSDKTRDDIHFISMIDSIRSKEDEKEN